MFKFERPRIFLFRGLAVRCGAGDHFTRPAVAKVPDIHKRQGSAIRRENLEFEVLSLLDAEPGMSQRGMARRLGTSLGRTNGCVRAMIAMGSITNSHDLSPRPRNDCGYRLTPAGLARRASLAEGYLQRKQAELDRLAGQVESLQRAATAGMNGRHP